MKSVMFYLGVEACAGRALDRSARVLGEDLGTGAASVVFRDRRQHLGEAPGLEVELAYLGPDQYPDLIEVVLEH